MSVTATIQGPPVTRVEQAAELLCRPGEQMLAAAWSRLYLSDDTWGLGFWFLASPLNWWRRRRRRLAKSAAVGIRLPEYGAVALTTDRLMFFRTDRLVIASPRFVAAMDRAAVRRADRPTVGGYLRTLNVWVAQNGSSETEIPLMVVGEPGDAVADALHAVRA